MSSRSSKAKSVERREIPGACLLANREIQRRRPRGGLVEGGLAILDHHPETAADLIGDAVLNRSSEIALQCPMAARLEAIDATKRLQQNVLNDIGGIRGAADPLREPAVCPPHQRRQLAAEQQFYGRFTSFSRAAPQVQG